MATNFISPATISPSSYVVNTYTLADIATQAYRLAGGLLLAGQGINPSEQAEILDITNHMVDGLGLEALMWLFTIRTVFEIQANKYIYSIGPGADWDMEVPNKITNAGFIIQRGEGQTESELPMYCVGSFEEYQNIVAKLTQSSYPLVLYFQLTIGAGSQYGSVTVWPVPNQDSDSGAGAWISVYSPGRVQEFQTLDDPIVTPKGWREFLIYELATKIHERPPYSKQVMAPSVEMRAREYKDRIKDMQLTPLFAIADPASRSRRNPVAQPVKAWSPYGQSVD